MDSVAQLMAERESGQNACRPRTTSASQLAESHFAAGILEAERDQLDKAAACFQKASAFITDKLGVSPWLSGYLAGKDVAREHSPALLEQIYANLGWCQLKMGRTGDARLALGAASRINPAKPLLARSVGRILSRWQDPDDKKNEDRNGSPANSTRVALNKRISLIITTHFTKKLIRNTHLSPPGTGLVQATYDSMLDVLGTELADCPKLLVYDRQSDEDPTEDLYQKRLESFSDRHGFNLMVAVRYGLQRNLITAISKTKTPYALWAEHDWQFLPPVDWLSDIVDVFDNYPGINSLRFNKRRNAIAGFDFLMEKASDIHGMNLIRTAAYSNNPQVLRVETMRGKWLPLCLSDSHCRQYHLKGCGFGIEQPIFKLILQDIRQMGFRSAHRLWGTYVYGRVNDPPRIRHLGC